MKTFSVKIDGAIQAETIDDVFLQIALHFLMLMNGDNPSFFVPLSKLDIFVPESKKEVNE